MSSKSINIDTMRIYLHGKLVGVLTLFPPHQNMFVFDPRYVEDRERPTLSLSFKSAAGGLITEPLLAKQKLPTFFSNLLPEGALREYLAKKAQVHPEREFHLLAALGQDLPGAIEIRVGGAQDNFVSGEMLQSVTDDNDALRFSLAGVQLKFSAVMEAKGGG